MRVGLFGGTFDPPHCGHLAVARAAVENMRLERLLLTPTARQPLKDKGPVASFADRFAMARLLCAGERALEASLLEAPVDDSTPNYTIDTIRNLRGQVSAQDEVFVVVGADAFLDIRRWREPEALLAEADWVVVSRPGFSLQNLDALRLSDRQTKRVHLLSNVHVPVSATELRWRLREGEDCQTMIPSRVLEYIKTHDLYGAADAPERKPALG